MTPHDVVRIIGDEVLVRVNCRAGCDRTIVEPFPRAGYETWARGDTHIALAMPDIPVSRRELLISGTCGECWDALYGEGR